MRHRATLPLTIIALIAVALLAGGCKKKSPVTASQTPIEVDRERAEPAEPTPAPEAAPAAAPDVWSSDLATLNAYVRDHELLRTVYFDFDRDELRPDAKEVLAANARFLKSHADLVVTIEGHADERGTNEYNLALGDRRASTARGYLGILGIARDQVGTVSYGEERPECSQSDETCWWRNRRAQFVIVGRRTGG